MKNYSNKTNALVPRPNLYAFLCVAILTILIPNSLNISLFKYYSLNVQGIKSPDGFIPLYSF